MALPVRRQDRVSPAPKQRWEPFRELDDIHEQMERLMQSVWSGDGEGVVWMPVADLEETDDAWIVEAELPGVRRDDVNVELRDNELIISGEIKRRERKGVLRRQTRRTGRFEYRVTLPGQADPENVEANLHEGVLTVRVPKSEAARPHRIEIREA
jgi:HSP20 family protein